MKMELNMEDLEKVTGGEGISSINILGRDFTAQELINLFLTDPETGTIVIAQAKAKYPGLIDSFIAECKEDGLDIPPAMKALL